MKTKTIPQLKKKAQILFNKVMCEKLSFCISCGRSGVELQAGHFYPTSTHDGLRYEEDNCWPECIFCNCFNEGHLIGYAENLLNIIGEERYLELKRKAANYKIYGNKWQRGMLEQIIAKYSKT